MDEKAPPLLKLSGVVNVVDKKEHSVVGEGMLVTHKVVIHLTDETKVVLQRDIEPFDGLTEGTSIELAITAPQTKLA